MNPFYWLSFILVIIILIINSIEDIKTRKVPYKNQLLLLFTALPMLLYNSIGIYQIFYFILIYGLFKIGMGGADARHLLILGNVFTIDYLIMFMGMFIVFSVATMIIMKSQKVPGIPAISLAFFVVVFL